MDSKNTPSSVCSSFSMLSINGQEIDAEKAIDQSFKDLQDSYNNIHVIVRRLLMADGRDDDYQQIKPLSLKADSLLKENALLIKDIRSIIKQLTPKKPRGWTGDDEKTMLNNWIDI